ncbi:MAG: hypothetical protein EOO02_22455, partial [Chitinophagaceae bacterium]
EFAFETGQIFGAETLQDTSAILTDHVNEFWRTQITTLPVELLSVLLNAGISQQSLTNVLREHLNGKKYIAYEVSKAYDCDDVTYEGWMQELRELKTAEDKLRSCLEQEVAAMNAELRQKCQKGNAKRYVLPFVDDVPAFLTYISEKRESGYISDLFGDLIERIDECDESLRLYQDKVRTVINHLYCLAIQQVTESVRHFKNRNNLLTFDDMIINLHGAILREGSEKLITGLRNKYKVVFIDEFQDTDRLQYEIFQKAFGQQHLLFYIGDPKQSIYAWRKADIFTYFEARKAVDHVYEMNVNYRSSATYINAMNVFFGIEDPFYFKEGESTIDYIDVETPAHNSKGDLLKDGVAAIPVTVTSLKNKSSICEVVAAQIIQLLDSDHYAIQKGGKPVKVTPSDIGILVRTN